VAWSADQATPANGNGNGTGNGAAAEEWFLRYRDRKGDWARTRATTRQIQHRLRKGRIPPQVEASRRADGDYQPLTSFPEFRDLTPPPARHRRNKGPAPEPAPPAATPPPASAGVSLWLVGLALAVVLLGGFALFAWLTRY
jgi:hypothetical protein